jgi:hypothetical protein
MEKPQTQSPVRGLRRARAVPVGRDSMAIANISTCKKRQFLGKLDAKSKVTLKGYEFNGKDARRYHYLAHWFCLLV